MTNLMSERHDGLVLSGLDVVVDEGDKGCVTAENITHTFTYRESPNIENSMTPSLIVHTYIQFQ